jgi:exoribonuclease II
MASPRQNEAETSKIGGIDDWLNRKGTWDPRLDAIEEQIQWYEQQIDRYCACRDELARRHNDICYG